MAHNVFENFFAQIILQKIKWLNFSISVSREKKEKTFSQPSCQP